MSTRPKWFRFVLGIFVFTLINTSLLVSHARSQGLVFPVEATLRTAEDKTEDELMEEFFPYSSKTFPAGLDAENLITAATYPFSVQTSVALEDMSSGTTELVGPALDDTASAVTNIGFEFWFDGARHTQFSINANGLARLGGTAIATTFNNSTSGLNTVTNAPKIAAYFEDLCTGPTGKVHYKVVGSAPNRKLVVEWRDMKIPRESNCTAFTTFGTFQMWLFESAAMATPGRIQFVYGAGVGPSDDTDLGASIGLQSGAATNFASVTVSDDSVSYATANNTNLEGVPAGKSYIFTPNVPAAPSGLTFSPVTQISIQLNWTDNATNEFGYAIYRSTDGMNYNFLTQTAADAVNFNDTDLLPGTTYHYRVHAVTEGAISSGISGSQATNPATNDSCAGAGGLWSNSATWTDATVPSGGDNVTIGAGCTVTVDVASAAALSLNVAGTLQFVDTPASNLTVTLDTTIAAGGTVQSAATGTVTTHLLSLGGNLVNNGTLDLSTNGDTAGAELRFTGAANNTWTGTGTNDLRILTVSKGSGTVTPTGPIIDVNVTNMTVRGLGTGGVGFLNTTLFNGIVKFSGSNTFSNPVFQTAAYTIPATGGIWFDNSAFTVVGQNGSPTTTGMLRLTNGTLNVGTSSGNSMGGGTGGQFIIEGGTANIAGRLQTASTVSYTQSGGTVNVCTVGNAATTACFGLTSTANTFNMTGGSIVLNLPNTNAAPLDYSVSTAANFVASPAGTTLQLGSGATPPATTFRVLGATPNIVINSGHSMAVGSGTAGGAIFFRGSTVTNNGAIIVQGTGASSRFDWAANGPMTYTGSGTFGTAVTPFTGVGMSANSGNASNTTLNSPIFVNRINVFAGGFVNSGQITLGNDGTSTTVVQIGNSTTPTNAGTFDVSPVYNSGTGGHIVLHLRTTTMNRPTGFEINPTRTLSTFTVDDNAVGANLVLTGGNLAVTGPLNLTNGVVSTGASTITHNGVAARTNGYVDGRLARDFAAAGTYTYHVGDNEYSPATVNVTAVGGPSSVLVQAVDAFLQGFIQGQSLSRHWNLTETGDVTADLSFTYGADASDVNGDEADYRVFKRDGGGIITNQCSGGPCVNVATNTLGPVVGVTDFSAWTGAEADGTDTTAPDTQILTTPSNPTTSTSAEFTFTGTDSAVATVGSFECKLDDGAFETCTSPKNYTGLAPGSHTFQVRAIDTAGNVDPTPASFTWTITGATSPVTVTATAGTMGPTPYNTVKEAFDAINAGTHQGAINVAINANTTETATASLDASGGTASYTSVLIRPTVAATVSGSVTGAIIKLNGADNVTIDGRIGGAGTGRDLTVRNNSATAASAAIWLSSTGAGAGATGNTIRNLEIAAGQTADGGTLATFGVIMNGAAISVTSDGNDNDNNSFIANRITRARYALVTRGVAANNNEGLVITDNIIGPDAFGANEIGKAGLFLQGDTGAVVSRNTVQYVGGTLATTTAGADRCGICIGGESWGQTESGVFQSGDYTVTKNIIHDVIDERTFSAAGIRLGTTRLGMPTNNLVANNFVYNIRTNGTAGDQAVGIGYAAGHTDRIVFNSIAMTGDMDPAGATNGSIYGNAMRVSTVNGTNNANLTMQNNSIFMDVNSNTATVHFYAITLPVATYSFGTGGLNYNNYYVNQANPQMRTGGIGTTSGATPGAEFQTLANWQAALTTPQDANSIQADPLYFSNTLDLHIQQASPNINAGTAIAGIADDIDAQVRPNGASPDIGADEFYPSGGSVRLSSSSYEVSETGGTVTVTVFRLGGANGAASVDYATGGGTATGGASCAPGVDYVSASGTLNWADLDAAPKSVMIQICADGVIEGVETFNVTLSNPMTVTLGSPSSAVVSIFDAGSLITGTINVGTGEAITSLTNPGGVFDVINNGTVTGNTTINITSDLTAETGAVQLNEFASPFTITIKPAGAARTISGTSSATTGLIGFNAADRVTIDGSLSGGTDRSLTVESFNTATTGGGIYFASVATNGATNNTVKNVNVWGGGSTTGTLLGITFASNTFGALGSNHDDNRIENNDIRGAFYGIAVLGESAANPNTGTVITKNVMPATGAAGIGRIGVYLFNNDGAQITENTIASVSSASAVDCIGLAIGNQNITLNPAVGEITNATIARNSIGVINNTATNSSVGIVLASGATGTNNVVNNMVSGVIGNADVVSAATNDVVAGILIIPRAGATQNVYHNSVSMTGNRGTTNNQAPSFALAITADQPTNVVNNILVNSQTRGGTGGGGESYAIGFDGPAANANLMSNFNDLFVSGAQGQVGITGDLTTAAQTPTAGAGTNQTTLAAWQAATTEDANSFSVDPLFVSDTDLHLQAMSPMINAGTNVGVTNDFDGQTRVPPVDIGADEIPAGPSPGVLAFSSATYNVSEAGPTVTLTVNRTGGSTGAVTVDYTLGGGTATGGSACGGAVDYDNDGGTLMFADGETSKTFNVTICEDVTIEGNETFNATLTNATGGATIGMPNPATVTIIDNDSAPATFNVAISDARVTEGNSGTANLTFNVTLTAIMPPLTEGGAVASVQYATANGTATAGSDYGATMGTLNFNTVGTQTVTVVVSGDTTKESNEFLFVNLSNPSANTTITDSQGAGIIVDEDRPYVADFDRDIKSDFSVFRPSTAVWYVLQSSNLTPKIGSAGPSGDVAVPGDYDADGKADFAVFQNSSGNWSVFRSSDSVITTTTWGVTGDKPVQGDYDGDGKTDFAIFRPSNGQWWILRSATSTSTTVTFGISTDKLVQGEYDGDFKTDIAVYRNGTWFVLRSSDGSVSIANWGNASDRPVSGDFDGDGRNDLAVYRSGVWWILNSLSGTFTIVPFGLGSDVPAVADYDGDGTSDLAVFRGSTGDWYVLRSSDSTLTGALWGVSTDVPVPTAYIPQ